MQFGQPRPPCERQVGSLNEETWWGNNASVPPTCDAWFIAVARESTPASSAFGAAEAAAGDAVAFELTAGLEASYSHFGCEDCAGAPLLPEDQYERNPRRPPPPPPTRDRHGVALSGDCEACGLFFGGTAEAVVHEGAQRLRLVHALHPRAPPQRPQAARP